MLDTLFNFFTTFTQQEQETKPIRCLWSGDNKKKKKKKKKKEQKKEVGSLRSIS